MTHKKKARKRPGRPKILKADLHIHTARSGDSDISAWDVLEQARASKLDVVGITDHNTTKGGLETKRIAVRESPRLTVLVGQEVMTDSGEIIVFGIDKTLPRKEPLVETCKRARRLGGLIVVPHPFDVVRHGIGKRAREIIPYIDAVEVLNSKSVWKRFNRNARAFAQEHGLPMVAGSDAHLPQYIGMAYTLIEVKGMKKPTEKGIYHAIKSGKTACSGRVAGLSSTVLVGRMMKLVRKIRRRP
jgi:predicted metal-dependent phosphoesterase TrpH